jgi:large subunit ribosomal protein L5
MNKIRKGDEVIVLAGRDKGKRGTVVLRKDDEQVVVEGINLVKKHTKPNPMKGTTGGIVEKSMPIHQSNVAIFNPRPARPTAWASRPMATSACASSSPAAKKSRWHDHGNRTTATIYREKVAPELTAKFGYKSPMQVPRLTKITLNMGVSEAVADKKVMDNAVADLTKIAGQKPVVTKAKKAIAGFKIREGQAIGCMVTLRGVKMYEFLDRFVTVALPRVRDFRGISGRAFDGRGNYNIGVKEQIIFPEIEYDKVDALRGLNISITTTAKTDDECKALLAGFRFPFKN